MPGYVNWCYAVSLAGLALVVFIPPPLVLARRAPALAAPLLTCALSLLVSGLVTAFLGLWFEGVAMCGVALSVLSLMFWMVSPRHSGGGGGAEERRGGDGGGGGNVPRAPRHRPTPGGTGLSWEDFDDARERWAADAIPPAERELVPA